MYTPYKVVYMYRDTYRLTTNVIHLHVKIVFSVNICKGNVKQFVTLTVSNDELNDYFSQSKSNSSRFNFIFIQQLQNFLKTYVCRYRVYNKMVFSQKHYLYRSRIVKNNINCRITQRRTLILLYNYYIINHIVYNPRHF